MIKQLFEDGINQLIAEGNAREAEKVGRLRAGNTGMIMENGDIVGSCAAETYLRMLGINGKPVDANKELMFAGGRLNEDHWLQVLKKSYEGPIACEEEIATKWKTANGIDVTGRPDIALCSEVRYSDYYGSMMKGDTAYEVPVKPESILELKQIMSVNSAYNVLIKREPQLKHLMQNAHYMWQHDCPGELWYTNRNNLDMPGWMEFREFPKPGEPGTESLGYRYYRMGDINPRTGKPKKHQLTEADYMSGKYKKTFAQASKIKPFVQGFKLQLMDGTLYYQDASKPKGEWIESIVTIERIKRFYEFVSELEQYGKVPKPALNLTATGDKIGWKFSDYSDLGMLDPEHCQGQKLNNWVKKVKAFLESAE